MLSASTFTNAHLSTADGEQLQDLESLSQRLRALENLLAKPKASTAIASMAGMGSGRESPNDEEALEEIMSQSSPGGASHRRSRQQSTHQQNNAQNHTPGSLSRRIQKIESALWAAAKERKPTEEFLQKYEASNLINTAHGSHSDRELLTLQAKTELVLAAQDELEKLAGESREIQSLQRCAEMGGLKNVEAHYPVLSKLESVHIEHCQETNKVSEKMNKLTDDYNALINTLSEVFLSWDALLTAAEGKVTECERARN